MKKNSLIIIWVLHLAVMSGAANENPQLDNVDDGSYHDPFSREYPLSQQKESLRYVEAISWSTFTALKHRKFIEGQIDGFLKVSSVRIKEGKDKGKTVYKYLLYKSKEDLRYRRLGSCIILTPYTTVALKIDSSVKDPKDLNERYCIVEGVFQREKGSASLLGYSVKLVKIHTE